MKGQNRKMVAMVIFFAGVVLAGVTAARKVIVPSFAAVNGDYRWQWHRVANEKEWKDFKVRYEGRTYCEGCHPAEAGKIAASVHANIQCEDCHGPADSHPSDPATLPIDKKRSLCLRCHARLPGRPALYAQLPGKTMQLKMVDPDGHYPGIECVACHDPHEAAFKGI